MASLSSSCKVSNAGTKAGISLLITVIFFVMASPLWSKFINWISKHKLFPKQGGSPGWIFLCVNTLVFFLIVFLITAPWKKNYICDKPSDD